MLLEGFLLGHILNNFFCNLAFFCIKIHPLQWVQIVSNLQLKSIVDCKAQSDIKLDRYQISNEVADRKIGGRILDILLNRSNYTLEAHKLVH